MSIIITQINHHRIWLLKQGLKENAYISRFRRIKSRITKSPQHLKQESSPNIKDKGPTQSLKKYQHALQGLFRYSSHLWKATELEVTPVT